MNTYGELIQWGETKLGTARVEQPRLEAELLLAELLGINRLELILQLKEKVALRIKNKFFSYIGQRQKRVPAGYILRNACFYGLEFYVDKGVLIPRPETELLVEEVVRIVNRYQMTDDCKKLKVLEIGVGSGAVAVALVKNIAGAVVYGTEISDRALHIARRNMKLHRVSQRVFLSKGNLFGRIKEKFDIIVANPPYLSGDDLMALQPEVSYEPRRALYGGKDGLQYYRQIIPQLKKYLLPRGVVAMEMGYGQAKKIEQMFKAENIFESIEIKKDYCGIERIIIGK